MRGGKIIASAAILSLAGCGEEGKLQIRSVSASPAAAKKPVPLRIAEGHRYAALGNLGLALESFRKAAREDPSSTDAIAGLAACYDSMGRFDLSRRYYEQALALAPGDPILLGALAASLDMQGRGAEAATVRNEIASRLASAAQAVGPAPLLVQSADATPRGQSVTVAVAPPPSAPVEPSPAPRPDVQQIASNSQAQEPAVALASPSPVKATSAKAAAPAAPKSAAPPVGQSVTVALAPRPAPAATIRKDGPRLERTSLGEVALITAPGPRWKARMADSSGPRFVPLRQANTAASSQVRLLNAARVDKLAARTRSYLAGRGWAGIAIGDAAMVRPRSLIVYPAGRREAASKLSAQFGFAMAQRHGVRQVTVLLGRDAAAHPALRNRG